MKSVLSGHSIDEVSKATKFDRSKISRWVNGKASPSFQDVYVIMNWVINVLAFFEPLIDLEKVPSLASPYSKFREQRELAYALPYLDALKEALTLRPYLSAARHDSKMMQVGVDCRADKPRMTRVLAHWLRETTEVVEKASGGIPNSLVGFSVFGLSSAAQARASKLLREFVRGMHAIGSEDQAPKEHVHVFTVSLVDARNFGPQK